ILKGGKMSELKIPGSIAEVREQVISKAKGFVSRLLENALHAATWEGVGKAVKGLSAEPGKVAKPIQSPMAQLAMAQFVQLFCKSQPELAPILQTTVRQFIAQDSLLFSLALLQDIAYSAALAEEGSKATIKIKSSGSTEQAETELPNVQYDGNYEHSINLMAGLIESVRDQNPDIWAKRFLELLQTSGLIGNTAINNLERGITHLEIQEKIRNLIQTSGETALALVEVTKPRTRQMRENGRNFLQGALDYWRNS
ncbi:MAG: hypothetical protein Q8N61_00620, partial [bacterium]|nr:hypothetical protein [bacterium]